MILHKMTKPQLIDHISTLYLELAELENMAAVMLADHPMNSPLFISRRDAAYKIRETINRQVQLEF